MPKRDRLGAVMVVRGTKKFLDRAGRLNGSEAQPTTGVLGDWYANVWFWRPQVALFVNAKTLLPVIVPLAPASSVIARFPTAFAEVAMRLGVGADVVHDEVAEMATWTLAKTASRSVLGVMNEFAHLADSYRERQDFIDLVELSLWLAHVPCTPLRASHGFPDLEFKALLAAKET